MSSVNKYVKYVLFNALLTVWLPYICFCWGGGFQEDLKATLREKDWYSRDDFTVQLQDFPLFSDAISNAVRKCVRC